MVWMELFNWLKLPNDQEYIKPEKCDNSLLFENSFSWKDFEFRKKGEQKKCKV